MILLLAASAVSVLLAIDPMRSGSRRRSLRVQAVQEPQGWGLTGSPSAWVEAKHRQMLMSETRVSSTDATGCPEATKSARVWEIKFSM